MLCTLAVHIIQDGSCMLRVSGSTALGPSRTGGRDTKQYPSADALLSGLRDLKLDDETCRAAAEQMLHPEVRDRFLTFAKDVQIPFEMLETADIYLFD